MGSARLNRLTRVFAAFAVTAVATLMLFAFLPLAWGWQPLLVTSGSMAPSIRPGDLVVVGSPAHVRVGDVITFERSGATITHRVVGLAGDGYRTQGDANPQADPQPVAREHVVGTVRLLVPALGKPALWLRDWPFLLFVPLLLLLLRKRIAALVALVAVPATGAVFTGATASASNTLTSRARFFPQAVIAAGPVAYWRLADSGTNRADALGGSQMICSGATSVPGAFVKDPDRATRLPTASARCYAANATTAGMTGPHTVMAWARATQWPETTNGRIVARFGGSVVNYMLAWNGSGNGVRFLVDTTSGRYTATRTMSNDGLWHWYVGTWDGANVTLYVDGAVGQTVPAPGTLRTTTTATTIGYTASDSMVGDIDEVAIINRALSPAEVADLYSLAV